MENYFKEAKFEALKKLNNFLNYLVETNDDKYKIPYVIYPFIIGNTGFTLIFEKGMGTNNVDENKQVNLKFNNSDTIISYYTKKPYNEDMFSLMYDSRESYFVAMNKIAKYLTHTEIVNDKRSFGF